MNFTNTILHGDSVEQLKKVPDGVINMCVTSPPYYGLRNYDEEGQIGLEETPEHYIGKLVAVFREVRRVLQDDGTLWVNIGDSYNGAKVGNTEVNKNPTRVTDTFEKKLWRGAKPKDLIGIPWMLAFALRADGWYLRQDIIWHKPNPMPESVTDRCTKAHEYIFLLSKSKQYYFDNKAIAEPSTEYERCLKSPVKFGGNKYGGDKSKQSRTKSGKEWKPTMGGGGTSFIGHKGNYKADGTLLTGATRNKRSVWTITTKPYKGAHFATFPLDLIEPCILAGCPKDGIVLDPFMGSGTTAVCALQNRRKYLGVELNKKYIKLADRRIINEGVYQENMFEEVLNG